MKYFALPITCGIALAALSAAGLSHWLSVRDLVALAKDATFTPRASSGQALGLAQIRSHEAEQAASARLSDTGYPATAQRNNHGMENDDQRRFYEALISRMETLQSQNRDLLDQLAETNRDLIKLEFRLDTHSSTSQQLPLAEDQPFNSFDTDLGVLPPRSAPITMSDSE